MGWVVLWIFASFALWINTDSGNDHLWSYAWFIYNAYLYVAYLAALGLCYFIVISHEIESVYQKFVMIGFTLAFPPLMFFTKRYI